MKTIKLNGSRGKGLEALVDDEDYGTLSRYSWSVSGLMERPYAVCGKGSMHRMIMHPPDDMMIDHINHNTLDNRKCNLRVVTAQENSWNTSISNRRKSKYRGVSRTSAGHWTVFFTKDNKVYTCDSYETELEAAVKYNEMAVELYGEFANINEFTPEEKEQIKFLSFQTYAEKRLQKSPYHGVTYNVAKKSWGWRFMYKGKLYADQYCDSAEDARDKLIKFLRDFNEPCRMKKYYQENYGG